MNAESAEPLQPSGASSTTGVRPAPRAPGQVVVCGWCSAEVTVPTRGRVPKWCSGTCRHRAWEQARAAASGRAAVTVVETLLDIHDAALGAPGPTTVDEIAGVVAATVAPRVSPSLLATAARVRLPL